MTSQEASIRPRVEGDRELEILESTVVLLADVGYDRLTMDAVTAASKASKATLYRRWNGKVGMVIDALKTMNKPPELPDTGTLRGDLLQIHCGLDGLMDARGIAVFASVVTALSRDEELAEAFRDEIVGPKLSMSRQVWERARDRGEIPEDLDLDLLEPALAGILLHRVFVLGEVPDPRLVSRALDSIILPAARIGPRAADAAPHHGGN